MSLTRREVDELRALLDKTVQKFLGFSEPTLVSAALDCLDRGYDKRKTIDKLTAILDNSQATNFTDRIFDAWDEYRSNNKSLRTKRKKVEEPVEEVKEVKRVRRFMDAEEATAIPAPGQPSPGQLSADRIKEMMANAQRMIQERKAQLSIPTTPTITPQQAVQQSHEMAYTNDADEKARRVRELQAQIQAKMSTSMGGMGGLPPNLAGFGNLGNMGNMGNMGNLGNLGNMGNLGGMQAAQQQQGAKGQPMSKPTPLILNEMGQTIDATTGQAVQLALHTPTLKANIRAKKREQFKGLIEKPPEEISDSRYFDPRVGVRASVRQKRGFKFHEKGKFEQLAQRLRTKAQLERLHADISSAAKKTGIASAARLATIAPKKEIREGEVPDIEWWDSFILKRESYEGMDNTAELVSRLNLEGITNLIEHPLQLQPPDQSDKEVVINAYLTKKERKKLRRQNRSEAQKEKQEKIRLGLLPPEEPKVRMANMMRALGTEAVQDPTTVERFVREQMAKRQKNHEEANAARKLTAEQRRDKKIKKLKEDTSHGIHVSVYRVRDLHDPAKKFKVEKNAQQLFLTGLVIMYRQCNVVVVEGGPKQLRKFRNLMLTRIKWAEDRKHKKDEDNSDEEEDEAKGNLCKLVWEGTAKSRAFGDIKFKVCPTETFAREQFSRAGVGHYWDLAFSSVILEDAEDE